MAQFRKTGKLGTDEKGKGEKEKYWEQNSPTKGRRISSSDRVGGRASALGSGNLIAQDGGEEQGGRLHHVRAAASLHPHGDAGDGEVLTGTTSITVRFVVLGEASVGVELVADEEQLLTIAPWSKDVLDHETLRLCVCAVCVCACVSVVVHMRCYVAIV